MGRGSFRGNGNVSAPTVGMFNPLVFVGVGGSTGASDLAGAGVELRADTSGCVGGGVVGSGEPGEIMRTAAMPATRLHTAAAPMVHCRRVGIDQPAAAGSAFASGFGGSAFTDGTGFGPGIVGTFTGASTAIGSIRGPLMSNGR